MYVMVFFFYQYSMLKNIQATNFELEDLKKHRNQSLFPCVHGLFKWIQFVFYNVRKKNVLEIYC